MSEPVSLCITWERTLRLEAERSTLHNKKLCSFDILDIFLGWKWFTYPSLIGCILAIAEFIL
jgi:hypothetical protein